MLYVNPVSPALNQAVVGAGAAKAQQKQALQEMEHMFLYTLLREMRQTVSVAGEKKGREMDTFEEMLDDALSGEMAKSGQVGMAQQIEQQLNAIKTKAAYADNRTVASSVLPMRPEENGWIHLQP